MAVRNFKFIGGPIDGDSTAIQTTRDDNTFPALHFVETRRTPVVLSKLKPDDLVKPRETNRHVYRLDGGRYVHVGVE